MADWKLLIISFLSLVLLFNSCTVSSDTYDPLTYTERSNINKIAVLAKTEEEFDVNVFQTQETLDDLVAASAPRFCRFGECYNDYQITSGGGLLWLAVLALDMGVGYANYRSDENIEDDLRPLLENYNPAKVLASKLIDQLDSTNMFGQAEISDTEDLALLKKNEFDAILEMKIEKWGLFICTDLVYWENWEKSCKYEQLESLSTAKKKCPPIDKVNAMIVTNDRMYLIRDNINVWEQRKFYFDNTCETLDNLRNQEGLLLELINNAIDRHVSETVNELNNQTK